MGNHIKLQKPEASLIEAAKLGSVEAFEQLIKPIEKKMLGLAIGLAYHPDDAEDIYQEAMLSAFKAIPNFRLESQFTTWLYRIVVNSACNSKRKLTSKMNQLLIREQYHNDGYQEHSNSNDSSKDPEQVLVNQQLSNAIDTALKGLSEQEKIAFVVCHQQEFKIADAAEIMNCSTGTVKSTLFRAREKMRIELKDYLR